MVNTLSEAHLHFVFCVSSDRLQPSIDCPSDSIMDVPYAREQIRGFNLLEQIRVHKEGGEV